MDPFRRSLSLVFKTFGKLRSQTRLGWCQSFVSIPRIRTLELRAQRGQTLGFCAFSAPSVRLRVGPIGREAQRARHRTGGLGRREGRETPGVRGGSRPSLPGPVGHGCRRQDGLCLPLYKREACGSEDWGAPRGGQPRPSLGEGW